jgi:hypothetical protein
MLMKRGDMLSSPSADEVGGPRDVRAAVLEEEMSEQRFSGSGISDEDGGNQRTSQRAERAIRQSAIRSERSEQSN